LFLIKALLCAVLAISFASTKKKKNKKNRAPATQKEAAITPDEKEEIRRKRKQGSQYRKPGPPLPNGGWTQIQVPDDFDIDAANKEIQQNKQRGN